MNPPFTTVLVIARDVLLRQTIQIVLRGAGYLVICADDEKHAAHLCSSLKVNLVLLDVSSEEHAVPEFLKELRGNPVTEKLPVVLMTSLDDVTEHPEINWALTKPVSLDVLLKTVRMYCQVETRDPRVALKKVLTQASMNCA